MGRSVEGFCRSLNSMTFQVKHGFQGGRPSRRIVPQGFAEEKTNFVKFAIAQVMDPHALCGLPQYFQLMSAPAGAVWVMYRAMAGMMRW